MWRADHHQAALKNGSGTVEVVEFKCVPDKPHSSHHAYRVNGTDAIRLGPGRYRWQNPVTGEWLETKSGHAAAVAKRIGEISQFMQQRAQDPKYIEHQRNTTTENWGDPAVAKRRSKGTKVALAKPDVKKRHIEGTARGVAKRKIRLFLTQRTPEEAEAAARITLAACLFLEGITSKRAMRHELFPRQNVVERRYDDTKQFFRRCGDQFEAEKLRVAGLSQGHRQLTREIASSLLRVEGRGSG